MKSERVCKEVDAFGLPGGELAGDVSLTDHGVGFLLLSPTSYKLGCVGNGWTWEQSLGMAEPSVKWNDKVCVILIRKAIMTDAGVDGVIRNGVRCIGTKWALL